MWFSSWSCGASLNLLIFSKEAAELGLGINWNKTKIQSLSDFLPKPPDLFINDTRVESIDSLSIWECWSMDPVPALMRSPDVCRLHKALLVS